MSLFDRAGRETTQVRAGRADHRPELPRAGARRAGGVDHALAHARSAIELCEHIGDRHLQAALQDNIADLLHAAGWEDEAMTHLTRAVELVRRCRAEAGPEPEIRKLVDW